MKNAHLCTWGEQCDALRKWHRIMSTRVRVFDNEGATADRYSVAIARKERGARVFDIYTMSEYPTHPQGINQYSHTVETALVPAPNEKRIKVQNLPREVITAIEERV